MPSARKDGLVVRLLKDKVLIYDIDYHVIAFEART